MDANDLVGRFVGFRKIHEVRDNPDAQEVFDSLPTDPQAYVGAVLSHYQSLPSADDLHGDAYRRHARFEGVIRELLYRDRRTLRALLAVLDWLVDSSADCGYGLSLLAYINCVLRPGPIPGYPDEELVRKFERYIDTPHLHHNASECRNIIWRRRDDLRDPDWSP